MDEIETEQPDSLLPYVAWTEQALREVPLRALEHVAVQGLPGEHHFYLTFRTDFDGVVIPARLLARYPHEMTIVLQHQFWDLKVDPHAQFQLQFEPMQAPVAPEATPEPEPAPEVAADPTPQVVSLDSFRRRTPPKD